MFIERYGFNLHREVETVETVYACWPLHHPAEAGVLMRGSAEGDFFLSRLAWVHRIRRMFRTKTLNENNSFLRTTRPAHGLNRGPLLLLPLVCGFLLTGCGSTPSEPTGTANNKGQSLPAGVTLHKDKDKDINGVWLAPGFTFKGYGVLFVSPPVFAAVERTNEVQMRAMAMQVLPEQLTQCIRTTGVFSVVTTVTNELKADAKLLTMENTIIEYQKGGGGARYWAGLYGGGQPVIKVRGRILDGENLMCVYEMRRSGESAGAHMLGGYNSDEAIQRNDIHDLASDLADFITRTSAK
jgi:hypothetical protein